jgi:hypothetical protein
MTDGPTAASLPAVVQQTFQYLSPKGKQALKSGDAPFTSSLGSGEEKDSSAGPIFSGLQAVQKTAADGAVSAGQLLLKLLPCFPDTLASAAVLSLTCVLSAAGLACWHAPMFSGRSGNLLLPHGTVVPLSGSAAQDDAASENLTKTQSQQSPIPRVAPEGIPLWASHVILGLLLFYVALRANARSRTGEVPLPLSAFFLWVSDLLSIPAIVLLFAAALELHPSLLHLLTLATVAASYAELACIYFTKATSGDDLGALSRPLLLVLWILRGASMSISELAFQAPSWIFAVIFFRILWRAISCGRQVSSQLSTKPGGLRPALVHAIPVAVVLLVFPMWTSDAPVLLTRHAAAVVCTVGATFGIVGTRIVLQIISSDPRFKAFYTILLVLCLCNGLSFVSDIVFASAQNYQDEYMLYAMEATAGANLAVLLVSSTTEVCAELGVMPWRRVVQSEGEV